MNTFAPTTEQRQIWYLATLGRDALLRELAPLGFASSTTHDPMGLAAQIVSAPLSVPAAHQAAQTVLRPLLAAETFSVSIMDDLGSEEHLGIVPVIGEHTAGAVTGLYAELLLFDLSGLLNKAAYRLSRLPDDRTWIIDTEFQPSGVPATQRPFGSSRLGRNRTVLAPFAAELDRLASQARLT
ncbi:hypothetical protein ACFXKW_26505 [Streptomyces sp. NPDC059193]|uniref:hypothetical protein n=1 Tax=Streptomyces sp. NPDC059193 TaxID=3346763 RepID=UPI0036B6DA23